MTKEQFYLKYRGEKVAVHCDTEEKAKALFKLLIEFGVDKWPSGEKLLLNDTRWEYYKENTVYYIHPNFKPMWGDINGYAKDKNFTIIPFELDEPKETFKVGDVVYANDSRRPLTILRKAWVVCYQDKTAYEYFLEERYLTHKKPLTKITKEQLAEMGYEVE